MPVIAVDGPAASGKGTIARAMAGHYGLPHLDTGALYRAVAVAVRRNHIDPGDGEAAGRLAHALDLSLLEDPSLRSDAVAAIASQVSAHPPVRAALLAFQQRFAAQEGGAVLDGRDIGTVVAPQAEAKLFVTARPEVRAHRRYLELLASGQPVHESDVLADILARDQRDTSRVLSPLQPAHDAVLLDTSDFDIGAAIRRAIEMVDSRLKEARR